MSWFGLSFCWSEEAGADRPPPPEAPREGPAPDRIDRAQVGAAAGILGGVCIFYLICIAIWLFLAIWIMRDAKKRNSPNRTLVTVLGWIPFTTIIGLIVHLVTRPKTIPGAPTP